jgi:hypothetical protein
MSDVKLAGRPRSALSLPLAFVNGMITFLFSFLKNVIRAMFNNA